MKKVIFTFILLFVVAIGVMLFIRAHKKFTITCSTGQKLEYTTIGNKEVEVVGFSGDGDCVIPSTVKHFGSTYKVTAIGDHAFRYRNSLTSVIIPNSVTSIGEEAFAECDNLTSVNIPNSITYIENNTFYFCTSLTSVNIPYSITSIGAQAFFGCASLTSINIPNSITSIGEGAFSRCSSLTSISVDKGNPVYDSRDNCNAIIHTENNELIAGCQNTRILNSVTSIGAWAFTGSGLTSLDLPLSVVSIGEMAFGLCDGLTSVDIPNSITTLGNVAFYACSNLISINIPNSVTSIGSGAFFLCESLNSIIIPKSVTSIEDNAFARCDNMTSIVVDKDNPIYDSRDNCNAIIHTNTNTLIAGCQNTRIPNSVTTIGKEAFFICTNLKSR